MEQENRLTSEQLTNAIKIRQGVENSIHNLDHIDGQMADNCVQLFDQTVVALVNDGENIHKAHEEARKAFDFGVQVSKDFYEQTRGSSLDRSNEQVIDDLSEEHNGPDMGPTLLKLAADVATELYPISEEAEQVEQEQDDDDLVLPGIYG